MWNRQELKLRGKKAFKANYWRCVLVAFLATLITGEITTTTGKQQVESLMSGNGLTTSIFSVDINSPMLIGGLAISGGLLVILINIFVVNPITVGCNNFFLLNRRDSETDLEALERGFKPNYLNSVLVMFMTQLFIALWTLLLIIPGIVKAFDYYLVGYILSENPDINYKDAQMVSRKLMYGHKWNAFVLELSFIGWHILGAMTFGILTLLYVNPYVEATRAELFVELAHPAEAHYVRPEAQTVEFTVEEA